MSSQKNYHYNTNEYRSVFAGTVEPINVPTEGYAWVKLDEETTERLDEVLKYPMRIPRENWADTFLTVAKDGEESKTVHDPHRLNVACKRQTEINPLFIVQANVRRIARAIHPALTDAQYTWMWSTPGGSVQSPHIDFSETIMKSLKFNVYSLVVPLSSKGAKLRVFKNSRTQADYNTAREIYIPRGCGLIFRGDLVHAGHKYKQDNHRLHVYLVPRSAGDTWKPEQHTYLLPEVIHKCQWCGKTTGLHKDFQNHLRYCQNMNNKDPNFKHFLEPKWENNGCTTCPNLKFKDIYKITADNP